MEPTVVARAVSPARLLLRLAFFGVLLTGAAFTVARLAPAAAQETGTSSVVEENGQLAPTESQLRTLDQLLATLHHAHYDPVAIDDDFSSQLLDTYLRALDPSRWYFTQRDVDLLELLRTRFDDAIESRDLDPAYSVFRLFQRRRVDRAEFLVAQLSSLEELTFDGDDYLELDRENLPWAADESALDELWSKRFKNDVLNLRLADQDIEKIRETLTRRYEDNLKRAQRVKSSDVFRVFTNSVMEVFDPHTEYFPPLEAENFDIRMSLSFQGIGALLGSESDYVRIERILPGGPAERDGTLKATDRIVSVGQGDGNELTSVVGWRVDEVVELVRGEKGTKVCLEILPGNETDTSKTHLLVLERDEVKLEEEAAKGHVVEIQRGDHRWKIGFIELPSFYVDFDAVRRGDRNFKSSARDVAQIVQDLESSNVDGIVLDLRGNSGGSLTEAYELAGLFLGREPVVQVRDSEGEVEVLASDRRPIWEGGLAVLVDRLSASASEIFAAAVQDSGRGVVVGSQTFGKGTVQTLMNMREGQLKLTLAKFYRPSGGSTQHRGVVPDVEFPSLYDLDEVGESALDGALPWDEIRDVPRQFDSTIAGLDPDLEGAHAERIRRDPAFRYLQERIAFSDVQRADTRLSLNEDKRRAERERDEQLLLEIENRRLVAEGKEPIESFEELEDEIHDPEAAYRENAFVRESAEILVDFLSNKV